MCTSLSLAAFWVTPTQSAYVNQYTGILMAHGGLWPRSLCAREESGRFQACVCTWGLRCSRVQAGSLWGRSRSHGGTTSTCQVTFEADDHENTTMVKGSRFLRNVIDCMRESTPPGSKAQQYSGCSGALVSDTEVKRVAEGLALEQAKKESGIQKRLKQGKELDQGRPFANKQLTGAIPRERGYQGKRREPRHSTW